MNGDTADQSMRSFSILSSCNFKIQGNKKAINCRTSETKLYARMKIKM